MASNNHKPLPQLPPRDASPINTATLSTDARLHRARLLRHIFDDFRSELDIYRKRDAWISEFEEALDDLSKSMNRGDWLAGLRLGRTAKNAKKRARSADRKEEVEPVNGESVGAKSPVALEDKPAPATPLDRIRSLAVAPAAPRDVPRHLVLCISPHGDAMPIPAEDSGFDIIPASIGCSFKERFALSNDDGSTILFGLQEWEDLENVRMVGGTFTLKGVTSSHQHQLLTRALRLSVYIQFALLLEQSLLKDLHVPLKYPRPRPIVASTSTPTRYASIPEPPKLQDESTSKNRNPLLPASLLGLFSRKSLTRLARSKTTIADSPRGGSLDLERSPNSDPSPARPSFDTGYVFRRLSMLGGASRGNASKPRDVSPPPSHNNNSHSNGEPLFITALKRVEESRGSLSTSPGVNFDPPLLLLQLGKKEEEIVQQPNNSGKKRKLNLKGDEKVGLGSILGWDGREARGKGMVGVVGFVRQQEISVLYSSHTPTLENSGSTTTAETSSTIANASAVPTPAPSAVSSVSQISIPGTKLCGKPRWTTYQYFSRDAGRDQTFGEVISELLDTAGMPCEREGCGWKRGEHEVRIVHDGMKVVVRVEGSIAEGKTEEDEEDKKNDGSIATWLSCKECSAQTEKLALSDGAWLFSFGKFLELLIYSPLLLKIAPTLCEHTSSSPQPNTPDAPSDIKADTAATDQHDPTKPRTSEAKFNILRHFSTSKGRVTFALSQVENVFDLHVPRLQMHRWDGSVNSRASNSSSEGTINSSKDGQITTGAEVGKEEDPAKKVLRKEIRQWWQGISEYMDLLEERIASSVEAENLRLKSLPRLPSADEAYDVFGAVVTAATTSIASLTPALVPLPPSSGTTPGLGAGGVRNGPRTDYFSFSATHSSESSGESGSSDVKTATESTISRDSQVSQATVSLEPQSGNPPSTAPTVPPKDDDCAQKIVALRYALQRLEQSLYTQLANSPVKSLNDVRRSFYCAGKGTQKRLAAWEKKHLRGGKAVEVKVGAEREPEWWGKGYHAVPGANVIIKEDDWGSIIAFTLSTSDYQRELSNLTPARPIPFTSPSQASLPAVANASSSFFSVPSSYKFFSTYKQPDPDTDDVAWHEPEPYSAVITRKEHIRDPTSILSIRDVLRKTTVPVDSASSSAQGTVISAAIARARPDVALSAQSVGGQVLAEGESVEELLHELEHMPVSEVGSRAGSRPASLMEVGDEDSLNAHIRRTTGLSAGDSASVETAESDATVGAGAIALNATTTVAAAAAITKDQASVPPIPPEKNQSPQVPPKDEPAPPPVPSKSGVATPASSSFASTIASSLGTAMRYVLNSETQLPLSPVPPPKHHGLLNPDSMEPHIDERPHIKYDWTIGKRLKFSCTVYYARQFDLLRKRCGVDEVFVKSLSKCANWAADGGKSKSNFWKTSDEKFIIKTLVNAWNVADLQFLIDLAPAYFRYMDSTANKATALAKLLGFYTIEIRNLETGNVQSKVDLLVMENLFYGQQVTKTFDLKGIQGRKVKPTNKNGGTTKTLFDGEWIEGQQKTLMLVRPHSKLVLTSALRSDAEFLAKSNIMDYSLLLGIDASKKEIACGLVDTIGSYTFAKTLEYKAKHGLASGKEVTVIPPADYQERFVNALEGYFVACPDKWSKPLDESQIISDPDLLPSVL
ncbi:hypothetical protein FA15DRAFT_672317 [Coprinopsis marcescibilis]|uniref:PIPK domain-containing protein n=1 Tax=Coprinopsis marcescibilis TaxID=230819 RepID=A0A5C3KML4_COPMA|nr:hypothetical protein FA15DRAFT_672317 [Coprinopsis marcescibilis]